MKIAITGANSSVGLNLLAYICAETDISVIAGVRSKKAMNSLPQSTQIDPRIISYDNASELAAALAERLAVWLRKNRVEWSMGSIRAGTA